MKKIKKGRYGYIDYNRKSSVIKSAAMFALGFSILISGWLYNGTRENVITVIAILAMLPASKWLVNAIMFLRFHTRSSEFYERSQEVLSHNTNLPEQETKYFTFYDSIITLDKGGSYPFNMFACFDGCLIGFTDDPKTDLNLVTKHIKTMLKNNDILKVSVKLYGNEQEYLARLNELASRYTNTDSMEKDIRAIALIGALSL